MQNRLRWYEHVIRRKERYDHKDIRNEVRAGAIKRKTEKKVDGEKGGMYW